MIIGKNAFRVLVTAQKALQAGVSVSKNIILILSVVVPLANAISNVGQMAMHGISPREMITGFKTKLVETEKLQKWEKRLSELTAERARYRNDEMMTRKIMAEEKSINDAIDRLSIAPMVRAGEFTSIVEGETEVDASISEGVWIDKMKSMIDRLPHQAGVVGRYAAITKDTAIYKGLARSVQYGDFLSKSMVYDHLTQKKGESHEKALSTVVEEFVAYNLLASRERQFMESVGMSWFWAYKIRSIKVAHRILRDNPLRALTSQILPQAMDDAGIGSGAEDNPISSHWQSTHRPEIWTSLSDLPVGVALEEFWRKTLRVLC